MRLTIDQRTAEALVSASQTYPNGEHSIKWWLHAIGGKDPRKRLNTLCYAGVLRFGYEGEGEFSGLLYLSDELGWPMVWKLTGVRESRQWAD